MATFLQWTLPMPIVASPGAQVSLSAILTQSFGSLPGAWVGGWIAYYGAAQLSAWNFQYWNLNSPSAGTWLYNGLDIGASTASTFNQTYVPVGSFGSASFRAGNDMGPLAYLTVPESGTAGSYTSYIQYSLITVDPNLMSATAGLGAPTAADIVAAAYRFNSYYGFVANNNDCHYIASDIAASAGATFPDMTGSLTPSQNEEGGFWRIVYRGSDPNPISNWQTLVKPGDIVRMGWIGGGQHTTTVLAVNPNGSIVVYDNGYYLNNVEGVGVHTVNYDQLTIAADTTIYRLTTDGLYLENDSLSVTNDAIPGTIFNDRILGGSGNDTIGGGAGDDTISSGAGNDIISGGLGTNTVLGGAGWNTASYNVAFAAATIVRNADGSVKISGSGFADTLTDIEIARFTDRTVSLRLRAASDFTSSDNSGVLFRNVATGDTGFYHLNADGSLQGWRSVGASATAYAIVGTGDFTGVGHADVLFRNNSTGDTGFYKLDSNGALQGWVHIGASSTAYSVTGVGDFNADGLADILYRNNATGDTGFYQLNSDGSFNSWHSLGASSTAYAIAGVGDFNGDGVSDVLFQNKATGDTGFYQLNSDGSLNSWHGVAMASTAYTLVGTGDFNRDGVSDVLFRDNTGGDIGFFQMNPGGTVQGWRDIGASSAAWSVAAVGDYNGDGASDILFRNGSTGDLGFYQLNADGSYQGWHGLGASSTAYSVIA